MTPATWIRDFVQNHKDYEHDSLVSDLFGQREVSVESNAERFIGSRNIEAF